MAGGIKSDPLKLVKNFPIRQEQIRVGNGGVRKSWKLMSSELSVVTVYQIIN